MISMSIILFFLFCLKAKHRVSSYSQVLKMEKDYIFFPSKKGE